MWNLQARYCIYNCPEYTFSKYISNFIPKSLLDACDIELLLHGDRIHLESHATDLAQRWNRLEGDPDARLQFIETQKAKVEEINRFAPLWKEWASARAKARKNELKRMREKTLQSAVGRLRLMGWKDELNRLAQTDYAPLRQHNALRNRFKMTDCIWDNISDKLVELLQDIQDTRLRDDRRRVLRVRLAALNGLISSYYANPLRTAETEYKPHFCDFIFMPEIREVIESSNEAELGPHCENALRVLLPTLIARWEAQTRRKLTRLLQPSARSSKGTDVLELAVTHFTCTECQCLLPYPEVLAHPCLRQLRPQPRPRDKSRCSHPFPKEDMVYEISTWEIGVMREPWSSSALCVPDAPFEEHLRNVIALSGRDPASVTRRELDALDVHLVHRNKKQSRLIPLRAVINFEWERFKATAWLAAFHAINSITVDHSAGYSNPRLSMSISLYVDRDSRQYPTIVHREIEQGSTMYLMYVHAYCLKSFLIDNNTHFPLSSQYSHQGPKESKGAKIVQGCAHTIRSVELHKRRSQHERPPMAPLTAGAMPDVTTTQIGSTMHAFES
ncbi:hypothetical protein IEO21_05730 [Rhodonia placenta]|uniref:Uncharacterized protein n=1 Tax=Rhodonia placenta TaxID=104341 RepID=A0A8H7U186_9APHY|nr:hypothetical protein IEO21_05730 [Postia placenta]